MTYLLTEFVGTANQVAIGMYLALSGSAAQDAVLTSAAAHYLNKQEKILFDAVTNFFKACRRQRNSIIHSHWEVCDDIEDAILRRDSKELIRAIPLRTVALETQDFDKYAIGCDAVVKVEIYKEDDFIKIENEINALHTYLSKFIQAAIAVRDDHRKQQRQTIFDWLASQPPILRELRQLPQSPRSDSSKPRQSLGAKPPRRKRES